MHIIIRVHVRYYHKATYKMNDASSQDFGFGIEDVIVLFSSTNIFSEKSCILRGSIVNANVAGTR